MATRRGMMGLFGALACGGSLCAGHAWGDKLDVAAGKAFRKIGIGPEQAEAYAALYEAFIRNRNSQIRRVLNNNSGSGEVPFMAKKRARRAAKKSVKKMQAVLSEQQLKLYADYLKLDNEAFLHRAGLD